MQGSGLNARLAKLPRGAGSWGEALDLKPLSLGGTADDGKRRRLTRAGEALDALNAVWRTQHVFHDAPLSAVEMLVLVGNMRLPGIVIATGSIWFRPSRTRPMISCSAAIVLAVVNWRPGMCARSTAWNSPDAIRAFRLPRTWAYVMSPMPRRSPSRIKARSSTTASRSKFLSREKVSDSRTRSTEFAGLLLMLLALPCRADNGIGLVAEVGGKLAMRGHDLAGRMDLLAVTRRVRGNLGGLPAVAAGPLQILTNLLAPRAGSVEVFLGVALDLRRSASANGDFIAEFLQSVRQFGLIDGGGELLRSEKALRLDRPRLTILALGHIENDRMGMELWRNIPIHRTSCIVLEFGGDEFARSLWRMVPADAGLRIVFELFKGCGDALAVRLTHTIIASDKSGQRNGLWSGKGSVPSGPCSIVLTVFPSASWYS